MVMVRSLRVRPGARTGRGMLLQGGEIVSGVDSGRTEGAWRSFCFAFFCLCFLSRFTGSASFLCFDLRFRLRVSLSVSLREA